MSEPVERPITVQMLGYDLNRGHLLTELPNPLSQNLDQLSTNDLVELFCQNDLEPQRAVHLAAPQLSEAIEGIASRLRRGGRLFYLGAGTSGRLGVLDAAECPPTFCSAPELVQGILAGGAPALLRSSEGLEDVAEQGQMDLEERGFGPDDALVGIAAGGTTPYVLGALRHGQRIGALTIALACVPTKMALNILSTGVMVRLGKVYGHRMVDVSVSNAKLEDRALRIMADLAGVDRDRGRALLAESRGSVNCALLMAVGGMDGASASEVLQKHGPSLRATLEVMGLTLPPPSREQ